MKLVVISHKETWVSAESPSGYATIGGFPFQMQAISELFDQTIAVVPIRKTPIPFGARPLVGKNLSVIPIEEPVGQDLRRKLSMLNWLPRNVFTLWKAADNADAIHAPVGGDIGTIGILIALIQKKPLFVRHCGNWFAPISMVDRLLHQLLEMIAGGKNVVMATGGGCKFPSEKNKRIQWIFATTLIERELNRISPANPWKHGNVLRLIYVGRLSTAKNVTALIHALPYIQKEYEQVHLDILGDGNQADELQELCMLLGVNHSITFHGNTPHEEVIKRLCHSHLFVFPTLREGFPKVVLEAFACGVPVIASNVSVLPHLIKNENGMVLENSNPSQIAKAVLQMISDEKKLEVIAANTLKTSRKYTLENWRDTIRKRLESAWGPLNSE